MIQDAVLLLLAAFAGLRFAGLFIIPLHRDRPVKPKNDAQVVGAMLANILDIAVFVAAIELIRR